jgi:hypothetical protein
MEMEQKINATNLAHRNQCIVMNGELVIPSLVTKAAVIIMHWFVDQIYSIYFHLNLYGCSMLMHALSQFSLHTLQLSLLT